MERFSCKLLCVDDDRAITNGNLAISALDVRVVCASWRLRRSSGILRKRLKEKANAPSPRLPLQQPRRHDKIQARDDKNEKQQRSRGVHRHLFNRNKLKPKHRTQKPKQKQKQKKWKEYMNFWYIESKYIDSYVGADAVLCGGGGLSWFYST